MWIFFSFNFLFWIRFHSLCHVTTQIICNKQVMTKYKAVYSHFVLFLSHRRDCDETYYSWPVENLCSYTGELSTQCQGHQTPLPSWYNRLWETAVMYLRAVLVVTTSPTCILSYEQVSKQTNIFKTLCSYSVSNLLKISFQNTHHKAVHPVKLPF